MPFIRTAGDDDPGLLGAFRKQVRAAIRNEVDPGVVLLMWAAEPGITTEKPRKAPPPRPGSVQQSPFTG